MIKQRIVEYLDSKGVSKYEFYKKTGLSNGFLDKEGNIGSDKCEKICYVFDDIDLNWLITGHGNMLKTEVNNLSKPDAVFKLRTDKTEYQQDIPLYNLEAAAGLVSLFNSQNDTEPIDYLRIPNLPKCDGALTVTGDSMYPLLKSGDIVMYKQLENEISNIFFGEMYLVSIDLGGDEYVSVKWIHRSEKGEKYIKLVSENQHHQPKDIALKKVKALALVKASVRVNAMR